MYLMLVRATAALICLLFLPRGCSNPGPPPQTHLKYTATGNSPQLLALYEGWFGSDKHISVGYSSHDPAVIRRQIDEAKAAGISAFVLDWYGEREPFIDESFSLLQAAAAKQKFHVAVMYNETQADEGATDLAIAEFTKFHDRYLSAKAPGREAYLTYHGRPIIFVFPGGRHTDWDKVRAVVDQWSHPPLLIDENLPGPYSDAFDGFFAWIHPGPKGWASDGSSWGQQYLDNFYQTMVSKFPNKMIVGGAWTGFDDSRASWGLNRHISARCGQTFRDTFNLWRKYVPSGQVIPFIMIETWNDYEEGSAVERGIPTCEQKPQPQVLQDLNLYSTAPAGH